MRFEEFVLASWPKLVSPPFSFFLPLLDWGFGSRMSRDQFGFNLGCFIMHHCLSEFVYQAPGDLHKWDMSERKVVMVGLGESVDSDSGSSVLRKSYQQSPVGAGRKQPKVKATQGWEHREGVHTLCSCKGDRGQQRQTSQWLQESRALSTQHSEAVCPYLILTSR